MSALIPFHVTVSNVSHMVIEAEDPDEARRIATTMLDEGELSNIHENSTGWEITDVNEE